MNNREYISYRNKMDDYIQNISKNPTEYNNETLDLIEIFEGNKEKKKKLSNPISGYAKVASKRFQNDLENIRFENLSKKSKAFAGFMFGTLSVCTFLAIGDHFTGLENGTDKVAHMAIGAFATPSLYSLTTFTATALGSLKHEFGRLFRESGIVPYFSKTDTEKKIHEKIEKHFSIESDISEKILNTDDKTYSIFNILKNNYREELENLAYLKNKKPDKEFLTILRDNIPIIEQEIKSLKKKTNEPSNKRENKKDISKP